MASTLHPNLARIAAAYDQIITSVQREEIDPQHALERLQTLVARDDAGVRWRLNPSTGGWERASLAGDWVADDPPTWGLATPTAYDMVRDKARRPQLPYSDPADFDPDLLITQQDIDLTRIGGESLAGSTLRALATGQHASLESAVNSAADRSASRRGTLIVASACAVVAVIAGLFILF